jgi:hypothetical protein
MATIDLQLREGITLDDLTETLARLVAARGCPACGLNGFDLRLGVDPVYRIREAFRGSELVRQINVLPSLHELPGVGPAGLG